MADTTRIHRWLDDELSTLLERHKVPAAAVAIYANGETIERATGTLNMSTGVEATTDSAFQIGSITKIWTATLVMQLVDEGLVDLDVPVRRYLPELRLAEESVADRVTIRHLLTHTAGFEGDIFDETTNDDDAVARFVDEVIPHAKQVLPPGELFSYSNSGFVLLGRLVEVMRNAPWSTVLRRHLADPLGIDKMFTNADEALLQRAAVGHIRTDPEAAFEPTKRWGLARSNAPAGALLGMSATDLLRFARLHLDGGKTVDGNPLLPESLVRQMRQRQVEIPQRAAWGSHQGLGWMLPDWPSISVFGHDGNTIGQSAFLRVFDEHNLAIVLLTNGGNSGDLYQDLYSGILSRWAAVTMPERYGVPRKPTPSPTPERYIGTYGSRMLSFEVAADGDALTVTVGGRGAVSKKLGTDRPERHDMIHVDGDVFTLMSKTGRPVGSVTFLGNGQRAEFLHNHRANPRE